MSLYITEKLIFVNEKVFFGRVCTIAANNRTFKELNRYLCICQLGKISNYLYNVQQIWTKIKKIVIHSLV